MKTKVTKLIFLQLAVFFISLLTVPIPTNASDNICDNSGIPIVIRVSHGCKNVSEYTPYSNTRTPSQYNKVVKPIDCKWEITDGRRYCKINGENKTGPFYAKLSDKNDPNWFYGIPGKGYVLMKSDGPYDTKKGFVYVAIDQNGKLLGSTKTSSGFVIADKKRYYIDSKTHGCRSGYFTIGSALYYGTSKGNIATNLFKIGGVLTLSNEYGQIYHTKGWYHKTTKGTYAPRKDTDKNSLYCDLSNVAKVNGKKINYCKVLVNTTLDINGVKYTFDKDGHPSSSSFPAWVEALKFEQHSSQWDFNKYHIKSACGVLAVTEAVQILSNNPNITVADVIAKGRTISGGMEDSNTFKGWAILESTPRKYGFKTGRFIKGNLTSANINEMRQRLQAGDMILANSQEAYFLNHTGDTNPKYRNNHTIMFYKYENGKFWAKDSGINANSIGYTESDLKNYLWRDNSASNYAVWVSKR